MKKYARLEKDIVMEIITIPDDAEIQKMFHASIITTLVSVPPEIRCEERMIFIESSGMFDDPVLPSQIPTVEERIAKSNLALLRVVDELAVMVEKMRVAVGGQIAPLSPKAQGVLNERKLLYP